MKEASGIILLNKDGSEVLLNLRAKDAHVYPDYWAILGGAVEKDETPEQAAARELEEETGYKTTTLKHILSEVHSYGDIIWLAHIYWGIYDGTKIIECLEGQENQFVNIDNLEQFKTVPRQNELVRLVRDEYKNLLNTKISTYRLKLS